MAHIDFSWKTPKNMSKIYTKFTPNFKYNPSMGYRQSSPEQSETQKNKNENISSHWKVMQWERISSIIPQNGTAMLAYRDQNLTKNPPSQCIPFHLGELFHRPELVEPVLNLGPWRHGGRRDDGPKVHGSKFKNGFDKVIPVSIHLGLYLFTCGMGIRDNRERYQIQIAWRNTRQQQ